MDYIFQLFSYAVQPPRHPVNTNRTSTCGANKREGLSESRRRERARVLHVPITAVQTRDKRGHRFILMNERAIQSASEPRSKRESERVSIS